MRIQFLTHSERERLNQFPTEIPKADLIPFFTLTEEDLNQVPIRSADYNRLGFALQLCTLRYLGFCPDRLDQAPSDVIFYIARQLLVEPTTLDAYGQRGQTRTEHLRQICDYLGFKKAATDDFLSLSKWMRQRALEHDKPTLLLNLACQWLYCRKILRPGVTVIERVVVAARQQAQKETYNQFSNLLSDDRKCALDQLLVPGVSKADSGAQRKPLENQGWTPLFWLRHGAVSNTPDAILQTIEKLEFLNGAKVDQWDLSSLNPNRQKFLATIGRRSTNQALARMTETRRYPVLLAFLRQSLIDITDELIDLFDRCLADAYARSKREHKEHRLKVAKTINEKLIIFHKMSDLVLDSEISDDFLRPSIYSAIPEAELKVANEECETLIRPKDDQSIDYFAKRYSYIRQFAKEFLQTLSFHSNRTNDPLLGALEVLKNLNETGRRKVDETASLTFVPSSWYRYVIEKEGGISRRYYELSALWELRGALRAGNVWVNNSRRYANPESYLIPNKQWENLRPEALRLLGLPQTGEQRLSERRNQLTESLKNLSAHLQTDDKVWIENEKLTFTPIEAEDLPKSCLTLRDLISQRLPRVDLTDLLIEVDGWTHFTDHLTHASGKQPRPKDLLTYLYASLLAPACNFGLSKMAEISSLTYDQLAWCSSWYIREETLFEAIGGLVNYQYHQKISHFFGGGTMSSSDGQRFPIKVKARNASSNPRYFGYGKGLTFYSWTSDQYSQYGSKVITSTIRDATYVLDAILDNETELEILEHTTDTAGYTELVFALFDLLGMQFSPRIRDLGDQHIYRPDKSQTYSHLQPVLKGRIRGESVLVNWDDILRTVASIKMGFVTASLFISKLQAYPRQNRLMKSLVEYGRLIKSIYIPRYLCDRGLMRRVGVQLNKGEAIHDLRHFLMFANEGNIRRSQLEAQTNQASALTLVTNAIICWNTRYISAIIDQLRKEGHTVNDSDIAHLSPCRFAHINKYGKYFFNVEKERNRKRLRAIRT